jgi:PLD-like domain
MSRGLFTNSVSRRDFIRSELLSSGEAVKEVFVATAFFTEAELLHGLADGGVSIRLVVRLGFPTSPHALSKVLRLKNIQVRYFSVPSFHPKLYIFGTRRALVGSANLTQVAILSNQEIVVTIDSEDERFMALANVFAEYWSKAKVLTEEDLRRYSLQYGDHQRIAKDIERLQDQLDRQIGRHAFPNIERGYLTENVFLALYRRTYQECVAAFRTITEAYVALGQRKFAPSQYPLRLELGLFINFVRDVHASGDSWQSMPKGWNEKHQLRLRTQAQKWHDRALTDFEREVVFERYPRLRQIFVTREHLLGTSDEELFKGLLTISSFQDRYRFFLGGLPALRATFFETNEGARIRRSLAHLVFDAGDPIERMAALIFNPIYKLNHFGQANVQELIGWTHDELPVINGRTTKILRYYGFEIEQLA